MDLIFKIVVFISNLGLIFITIITVPILFREFDDKLTNSWLKLSDLTDKGKVKIRRYSLDTIRYIYEKNGKVSVKKLFYIVLILNSLYGVAMYNFYPTPENIPYSFKLLGIGFFVIVGVPTMLIFERYAYKISIKAIEEYIKQNKTIYIFRGIIKILFLMYILPLFLSFIGILINQEFGIFMTGIFYFSPSGITSFMFNIFTDSIKDGKNYLLLLPMISTLSPIIFFSAFEFFYSIIKRVILPFIEAIDYLNKYVRGERKSTRAKIVIWIILIMAIIIQSIQLLS